MICPGAIICKSSAFIEVTGIGVVMPSRVMRVPVTVTSSTGESCAPANPAIPAVSGQLTATETLVQRRVDFFVSTFFPLCGSKVSLVASDHRRLPNVEKDSQKRFRRLRALGVVHYDPGAMRPCSPTHAITILGSRIHDLWAGQPSADRRNIGIPA